MDVEAMTLRLSICLAVKEKREVVKTGNMECV